MTQGSAQVVEKVRALIAAGEHGQAARTCEQALDGLAEAGAETGLLNGLLLTIKGRPIDAIAAYDMALSFTPDSLQAYMGIAENLAAKGWIHSAIVVMEHACKNTSFSAEAEALLEKLRALLANLRLGPAGSAT